MAGTLGVATLAYMPWTISNWIAIFFALLWAATASASLSSRPRSRKPSKRRAEHLLVRWGTPGWGSPTLLCVDEVSTRVCPDWISAAQNTEMKAKSRNEVSDRIKWFVIGQGVVSLDSCHLLTTAASDLYLFDSVSCRACGRSYRLLLALLQQN